MYWNAVQPYNRPPSATFLAQFLLVSALLPAVLTVPTPVLDCSLCDASNCGPFNSSACVKDHCRGCCNACARNADQACGDVAGFHGICADGYECVVRGRFGAVTPEQYYDTPGVCVANATSITAATIPTTAGPIPTASLATTEPADDDCRDKCDLERCMTDKNRYCSATENAFELQEERGLCQHTTCLACRLFVAPKCPTCPEPVNKRCLRKYFLCIADHYKEDNILLELSDPLAQNSTGRIICHVPEGEVMSGDSM